MTERVLIQLKTMGGRTLALLALAAAVLTVGVYTITAQEGPVPPEPTAPPVPELYGDGVTTVEVVEAELIDHPHLTKLTVEGAASRSVSYDRTTASFTISVLGDTVLAAVSDGNEAATAIGAAVSETCPAEHEESDDRSIDEVVCVSPNGLQTTGIRIYEEFDWTEAGRVSQGFRYENSLSIEIAGTAFAGNLIDLVIQAGGDHVRFDSLNFRSSMQAEAERQAQLDAIDDAQATAASIASHMGYEIVRISEITPTTTVSAYRETAPAAEAAMADDSYTPTPVFGGSQQVTSRITIIYELRPHEATTMPVEE